MSDTHSAADGRRGFGWWARLATGLYFAGLLVLGAFMWLRMQYGPDWPAGRPAPVLMPTATMSPPETPRSTAAPTRTPRPTRTLAPYVTATAYTPQHAGQPVRDAILRVNLGTYPDTLDPQKASFVNEVAVMQVIYEGLTRLDPALNTVQGAAEYWSYNADATEITLTLWDGLAYSDGSPLNAKRFEFSLLRAIDPETGGEYAAILDPIAGAQEWRAAGAAVAADERARLKAAVQVHALDLLGQPCRDYEQRECRVLRIGLREPAPYFHSVLSLWVTYPAKEENIAAGGERWWNGSVYQVSNGPFVIATVEPFVRVFFEPSQTYWRGFAPYYLEYRFITDGAVSFEAYKNDEFEVVAYGAEELPQIDADDRLWQQAQLYAGSCSFALMLHQERAPFTDKKVREAFAQAIDREAWVRDVLGGMGVPALSWIPPGYPGYDAEETRWAFDPEKARAALAESRYGGATGLPTLQWAFYDTARGRARAEWFAARFQEVLGATVQLEPIEQDEFTQMTKDKATAPLAFVLGWCADYPDPQNWLSTFWKTGTFAGRVGYSNPAVDALLAQGDTTVDPGLRLQHYRDAQRPIVGDLPAVMLWNNVHTYMVKPWVLGIVQSAQDSGWPGSMDPTTVSIDVTLLP